MMSAGAIFADAHDELFDELGVDITVARGTDAPVTVRAVVERGIERVGEYGQVIGSVTRVSFRTTTWQPKRGDRVTIGDDMRPIEAIDTDDGYVAQAVLHG